jgi:hypothetical protein
VFGAVHGFRPKPRRRLPLLTAATNSSGAMPGKVELAAGGQSQIRADPGPLMVSAVMTLAGQGGILEGTWSKPPRP